jgi:hypothetical protein
LLTLKKDFKEDFGPCGFRLAGVVWFSLAGTEVSAFDPSLRGEVVKDMNRSLFNVVGPQGAEPKYAQMSHVPQLNA